MGEKQITYAKILLDYIKFYELTVIECNCYLKKAFFLTFGLIMFNIYTFLCTYYMHGLNLNTTVISS
jgi:hypothetical protein